jgi:DNA-binding response OmpR family regulator
MNDRGFHSPRHAAHDLSKADSFVLGPLGVDPPSRRVSTTERSEMLEPRVMRVLIAFGEAGGKVLSRDDLIGWLSATTPSTR